MKDRSNVLHDGSTLEVKLLRVVDVQAILMSSSRKVEHATKADRAPQPLCSLHTPKSLVLEPMYFTMICTRDDRENGDDRKLALKPFQVEPLDPVRSYRSGLAAYDDLYIQCDLHDGCRFLYDKVAMELIA